MRTDRRASVRCAGELKTLGKVGGKFSSTSLAVASQFPHLRLAFVSPHPDPVVRVMSVSPFACGTGFFVFPSRCATAREVVPVAVKTPVALAGRPCATLASFFTPN